ncbi:MAG: TIGR00366 family protein [Bacteroidota bacterium]|nr:TIGR00366 family protein [Bacteroidota bacterium]MDX5428498.1 TIGR00366 family protein [Bacteroidota bacterium]MDX5506255.1 TIGR00366 family protein [Bacteroidota bacterium]
MSFARSFENTFRRSLPSPFSIAVVLTLITFVLAFSLNDQLSLIQAFGYWESGMWDPPLLVFAVQMMLMLVLGHVLALTRPVARLIDVTSTMAKDASSAAAIVGLMTMLVAFFNWGLGLIFGAIFARKIGEQASRKGIAINYGLLGAAGYIGLMVWHGGLSGSAPVKVAEEGHLASLMQGISDPGIIASLPSSITLDETVFSSMNLFVSVLLIVIMPILLYVLGRQFPTSVPEVGSERVLDIDHRPIGAEWLDHGVWFGKLSGMIVLGWCLFQATWGNPKGDLSFITPNFINLTLLGLGLTFHRNIANFTTAVDEAIGDAAGILIQFPLYFGIMGLMKNAGLVEWIADGFAQASNATTFPIFTFFSAGIINIFVPSGGGQWSLQGPIIVETCRQLNIPLHKVIMAMAYGDQITNMLQPFWALPLLGITGLKARQILPYTLIMMLVGSLIFLLGLMLF